jgi:tetratricopeptide (TPR) repeat protein
LHAKSGLVELSRLYHANGFFPEALACYEGLRQTEPTNARWPHLEASIMANFGRMDEALPLSQKAVELDPKYIPARLRLADVLLKTNRVREAANTYSEVLRREPAEPYALLGLARCDMSQNDWVKANERLQAAIAQHPNFIGALSLLVTVSERLGDRAAAATYSARMGPGVFTDLPDPWLDELSEVCFDPYLLSVAASKANFASNRPAALNLIYRAIALAPELSTYRRQAGQYLIEDQNFGEARHQLEKAVAVNPTDSDSWLRYIEALRGAGDARAVALAVSAGLANCPQSSGLRLEHARSLKASNRLDEAIAEFRYSNELRPSEATPLVELATTYLAAGRTSEAVESLNRALERQPDHPLAIATLAFIAISSNDEAEARRRLGQLQAQARTPADLMGKLTQAFLQQFGRPPN